MEEPLHSDKEAVEDSGSPLKQLSRLSKGGMATIMTPKKPGNNRSTSKMHLIGGINEDCENDASLAASSGKNSRRKSALLATAIRASNSHLHESKACSNAPRKKAQRPASARYL